MPILQDVRFALRSARKSPGFILTAVGTLALGIGANTAVFSIVSGVLLRPLPFSRPSRLVQLQAVSYPNLEDWRKRSPSFEGMVAYGNIGKDLQGVDEPERISAVRAERGLFQLLGVQAVTGRTFRQEDPENVVVIANGLWKRHYGGAPSCIGRKITLNGQPYTVIGVMGEAFQFPYRTSQTEMWIPWNVPQQWAHDRNYRVDFVVTRLKQGVSINAARKELGAGVIPLSEVVTGRVRPALFTLLGAVGVVLLIACANVMNLLLSRAAGRTHEIAIRSALGASRGRLIQQLLAESVLLSAAGGIAGLCLARFGADLLLKLAASRIPRSWEIGFDWRVFLFLLALGLGTGIVFGILPAVRASRPDVRQGTKDTPVGRRLGDSLVVAEIALVFVLVVSAGLLLRILHLQSTPTGFRPDNVLTMHLAVSSIDYAPHLHELEERLEQIPGVRATGFIQYLPLQNWGWAGGFSIPGRTQEAAGQEPRAELRYVSTGYFSALGVPILGGRAFTDRDNSGSPPVIVINQALARRYFANQDPIGQLTDRGTIVGVAGDVRQSGLDRPAIPEIYYAFAQNAAATSDAGVSLVVSARTRPEALVTAVREAIHQVNPNQVVFKVETMGQVIADSLADVNLYVWLIGLFAALAVLLAVAGVYGVISYAVTARTREFAVRVALGAGPGGIGRLVLGHGATLVACGLALGAGGTLTVTHILKSLVVTVTSPGAATLPLVGMAITVVAISACLIPARRAMRIAPNIALKSE